MPNYRRYWVPGGTYFFTLATYQRRPIFAPPENVQRLREAVAAVRRELPFEFVAGVILPDHMHFLWTLPPSDHDYSKRIGKVKAGFTKSLPRPTPPGLPISRQRHGESDVWQRRFWEHTVTDMDELEVFLNYIHFNPVKHGHARCPHLWPASSFSKWVASGLYASGWGCSCQRACQPMQFASVQDRTGEP
jgi:putative transposase